MNVLVVAWNPHASADDIAAWTEVSFGTDQDALTQNVSFGGTGQDMFETDGFYDSCVAASAGDDADYTYKCEYYRIATLYDGFALMSYVDETDGAEWLASANPIAEDAYFIMC